MTTLLSNENAKRRRLVRAIAILFLIYAGFDLASPQLCKDDALGDVAGKPVIVASQSDAKHIIETNDAIEPSTSQHQNQVPEPPDNDEAFAVALT